ncbi:hypothetical protein GOV13_03925 [Candidatus Pacearchaeota archaeon]|nr:hypothetical protein [Candidatus Pacearchaeota archaeon]
MKTIIIGAGEIGLSLYKIFSKHYKTEIIDSDSSLEGEYEVMHVCFPYSDKFVENVKSYKEKYNTKYTIIHSTVPIGTSRKCNAIHSPIEGLHPFLSKSILTFTKYLSGGEAGKIADYFRRANIKIYLVDKQESTELMKIMSTTFYGIQIEFTKEMKRLCEKYDVPFELFTLWNMNYNESYEKLGFPEYKKPLLVPIMKKQEGHCTIPNASLLDNKFTDFLKKLNSETDSF